MRKNRAFVLILLSLLTVRPGLGQDSDKEKRPKSQIPIEERETRDSFWEILGEAPGKIVTFPLRLVFAGVGKAAAVIDYQAIVLRVTDWLTNEDGTRRVRPIFTPVSGGGLIFVQDDVFKPGLNFRLSGSFGIRTRRNFFFGLRDPQLFSNAFGMRLTGFYTRLPDEDFFGIGNNTSTLTETNYLHNEKNVATEILAKPFTGNFVGLGVSYSRLKIEPGRDPNKPSLSDSVDIFFDGAIPGLTGAEMWTFLVKFYRDTRNVTGHPIRGGEAYFSFEFSQSLDTDIFGYRKFTVDLRRYLELFHQRVLALRVRGEMTDRQEGKEIPFFRLGGLGGEMLRGYRPVRFRDQDLVFASAEYRFPIHGQAVATLFFEEGRVFSDILDEFSTKGFKYSYGGGIRFMGAGRTLAAFLEFAKSAEQFRINFGLNTDLRNF